jgi:hypothetical protein
MGIMKIRFLLLILFCFNFLFLVGQNQVFEKHYSSFSSLCQFKVKDTLWLGTSNCLMKILVTENRVLQIYTEENSPVTKNVNAIWVDKSNRLCVIIDNKKIALLSNGNWQSWSAEEIIPLPMPVRFSFTNIAISSEGNLYCYESYEKKIYAFKNDNWKIIFNAGSWKGRLIKFLQHPDGSIWWLNIFNADNFAIKTDSTAKISLSEEIEDVTFYKDGSLYGIEETGDILKIKPNGTRIIKANLPVLPAYNGSIGVNNNEVVYVNVEKKLYVLKNGQLTNFINDKFQYYSYPANLTIDENEVVWIDYFGEDISAKFENGKFDFIKIGLSSDQLVKRNSNGSVLWFANHYFISSYNVNSGEISQYNLPVGNRPYRFAESQDPNQMWLATSRGLMFFDGNHWIIKYDTLHPKLIYDLKAFSTTQLIGSFSEKNIVKLQLYDINKATWTDFSMGTSPLILTRFYIDKSNRVWSNLIDSLTYFENGKWNMLSPTNSSMPKEDWIHLAFDSKNTLYVASNTNLYSYDGITWKLVDSILCRDADYLFLDSRDWIWLLNDCPGMSYYDGQNWIYYNAMNSNIPDIFIDYLEEDINGDIWASTNPGIRYKVNVTETKDLVNEKQDLKFYPNPTNANITINTKQFIDFSLRLFDLNGRLLNTENVEGRKDAVELSLNKYSGGMYFISVYNKDGKRFYGKVFKQ